ncbi:MAG: TIGR03936 family radical SAM-associated protein [Dehalococcoidales bacterium]
MYRLRFRFKRGPEIKFISHLDIIRLWQRAFRRAGIPLAYSEGFNPHPRISLAAPLALGVTSEAELMDVFTTRVVSPHIFEESVNRQLLPGINILQVYQIAITLPSLQSRIRYAEYMVEVETERDEKEIEAALASLLSKEHLPWQHQRDTGPRSYDLRALINDLWLISWRSGYCTIGMRLRCDSGGSGRPEQVVKALGFSQPRSIHRSRLILETS